MPTQPSLLRSATLALALALALPWSAARSQSDASLSFLNTSGGSLSPAFSPAVTAYELSQPQLEANLWLALFPSDPAARVEVRSNGSSWTVAAPQPPPPGASVSAGRGFSLALSPSGSVTAWGKATLPPSVSDRIQAVSAGGYHALTLTEDGRVVGWYLDDASSRNKVYGQAKIPAEAASGVVAIATGTTHSLALRHDGILVRWGDPHNSPENPYVFRPFGYERFASISSTGDHDLALTGSGKVMAWGDNTYGQAYVPPAALSHVVAVAAGEWHSLALRDDGSVIAWGRPDHGVTAVPQAALSGVVAISAGAYHNLALRSDGSVIAWGAGFNKTGADPDQGQSRVPPEAWSNVTAISAGFNHSLALKKDGTVVAWGADNLRPAETPTYNQSLVPSGLVARQPSAPLLVSAPLSFGPNVIEVKVTAADTVTSTTYQLQAHRPSPLTLSHPTGVGGSYRYVSTIVSSTITESFSLTYRSKEGLPLGGISIVQTEAGTPADFQVGLPSYHQLNSEGYEVQFPVTFRPRALGERTSTLLISTPGSENYPIELRLSGEGRVATPPHLVLYANPNSYNPAHVPVSPQDTYVFQPWEVGETFTQYFTVYNLGETKLTGFSLAKSPTENPNLFQVSELSHTVVDRNSSSTFSVSFRHDSPGEQTATLTLTSNDPLQNPFVFHLSSLGREPVPAEISVFLESPDGVSPRRELFDNTGSVRFPDTAEAHWSEFRWITVTNTGSFPLTGLTMTQTSASVPSDFLLSLYSNTIPETLAPHASTSFQVHFLPNGTGERTATFSLTSNDSDENPFEINLAGLGTPQPPPTVSVTVSKGIFSNKQSSYVGGALHFHAVPVRKGGNQEASYAARQFLKLENTGTGHLRLSHVLSSTGNPGDFKVNYTYNSDDLVPPGENAILEIIFTPSAPGPSSASLVLSTNVPGQPALTFSLTGIGLDTSSLPSPLLITEINYNPPGSGQDASNQTEFLEIKNISGETVDLATSNFMIEGDGDWYAGTYGMSEPDTLMAPGDIRLFVHDSEGFAARHPGVRSHGILSNKLDNTSNTLRLSLAGQNLFTVTYADRNPWPSLPDGTGFTLVSAKASENLDPKDPLGWRTSTHLYGSPGSDDPVPPVSPIVINELKTRDDTAKDSDVFELANLSDEPVDISGWFLSDSSDHLRRFRIPSGTIVAPRGFATFTQAQLGFGISGGGEDELILFAATPAGVFTGYKHSAMPGPSADGRSFIRVVSTDGREFFAPSETNTLGAPNSPVHVGPVVISEINLQPTKDTSAIVRTEYIELINRSSQPVNLFTPEGLPWIIRGIADNNSQDFRFPENLTLAPGEVVLLFPASSPHLAYQYQSADYAASLLRPAYSIPPSVTKIFLFLYREDERYRGSYRGEHDYLSNNSQNLELLRPESYPGRGVVYISEDRAHYRDDSGWPNRASGDGPGFLSRSLVRAHPDGFGSEPSSWDASPAHGGTPGYAVDFSPPGVVVSEVLAHSDLDNPAHPARTDFIELHNTTDQAVDISGWWLSNSANKLARAYDKCLANPAYALTDADSIYEIPAGTVIPAGGFWSVNSDDDDDPLTTPPTGFFGRFFTLGSRGDSVRLVAMDAAKRLTGYVSKTDFDATENAVSINRHVNSEGRETYLAATAVTTQFTTTSAFPVGAPNAAPAVPDVVISEIMYATPPGGFQFVELFNRSSYPVALYDNFNEIPGNTPSPRHNPDRGWMIPNLGFALPSTAGNRPSLAPGETILLTNAPTEAAFRAFYPATPVGVCVFPWGSASLPQGNERLKLQKPEAEDLVDGVAIVPLVNVDEVPYKTQAPWPLTGFGGGYSLERRHTSTIADDAGNWRRSSGPLGTPGQAFANLGNGTPTAAADRWTVKPGTTLALAAPGVLANDSDVDSGHILSARLLSPPPAGEGILEFHADGSFTFTPAPGFSGRASFTYLATDAPTPGLDPAQALTSAPATVTLVANRPPQAQPDSFTTEEDIALAVAAPGLLANDPDPDSDGFLNAFLVTPPPASAGYFDFERNGSFLFVPAPDFHGSTSFTYQTSDGELMSAPATVTLTVTPANDKPRAFPEAYTAGVGVPLAVPASQGVLLNDTDVDGDPLTAVLTSPPLATTGSVVIRPDGSFTFTPAPGFAGVASFGYGTLDSPEAGPSATAEVTITVIRDTDQDGLDDAWERAIFGSLAQTADGDPDGDGVPNLSELAFGLNALTPDAAPLVVLETTIVRRGLPVPFLNSSGEMEAWFLRRKDHAETGLIYDLDFSADLKTWNERDYSPTIFGEDTTMEAVRVAFPAALNDGRAPAFFRLTVSSPL